MAGELLCILIARIRLVNLVAGELSYMHKTKGVMSAALWRCVDPKSKDENAFVVPVFAIRKLLIGGMRDIAYSFTVYTEC